MKHIFESGSFSQFNVTSVQGARGDISPYYGYQRVTTVFISHKHDDLSDLKGIIGFLEKNYGVKAYIDSRDPSMPQKTSGVTAAKIKQRITLCDKFILLATNGAIESKWCNWELGFGDAKKFENDSIAIFPLKPKGASDSEYKGNEYMEIYPHIVYYYGTEKYRDGRFVEQGYYVATNNSQGGYTIIPLGQWLNRR